MDVRRGGVRRCGEDLLLVTRPTGTKGGIKSRRNCGVDVPPRRRHERHGRALLRQRSRHRAARLRWMTRTPARLHQERWTRSISAAPSSHPRESFCPSAGHSREIRSPGRTWSATAGWRARIRRPPYTSSSATNACSSASAPRSCLRRYCRAACWVCRVGPRVVHGNTDTAPRGILTVTAPGPNPDTKSGTSHSRGTPRAREGRTHPSRHGDPEGEGCLR